MTYTWGKLPEKGVREGISDYEELHVGDLVLIHMIRTAEGESAASETELGNRIKSEFTKEGQFVTYVRVNKVQSPQYPVYFWNFEIDVMVYIEHTSPLTGLELTLIVIAICSTLGIALFVLAPILWKWAGLSPDEVKEYIGALADPLMGIGLIVIVGMGLLLVLLSGVWKR